MRWDLSDEIFSNVSFGAISGISGFQPGKYVACLCDRWYIGTIVECSTENSM